MLRPFVFVRKRIVFDEFSAFRLASKLKREKTRSKNERKRVQKTRENAFKTVSKVEPCENVSFRKRPVSSVNGWKQRLLKAVPQKTSRTVASISVFGCFVVDDRQKRIKKVCVLRKRIRVDRWKQNENNVSCFFPWDENLSGITCRGSPKLSLTRKGSKDIKVLEYYLVIDPDLCVVKPLDMEVQ